MHAEEWIPRSRKGSPGNDKLFLNSLLSLYFHRRAVLVDRDEGIPPFGHLQLRKSRGVAAADPTFDVDGDGRPADAGHACINSDLIALVDRLMEFHGVDGDGHHARTAGRLRGADRSADVHLPQHPAAEDLAVDVG